MTAKEAYAQLRQTLQFYIAELDKYTDEQFTRKPDEDTWSVGQVYEHLAIANNALFCINIDRCLARQEGAEGGTLNEHGLKMFNEIKGFPPVKIKLPREYQGPAPVPQSREYYKGLFEKIDKKVAGRVEAVDNDANTYTVGHPRIGALNAQQWFCLNEMHFRHHLRQKEELDQFLGLN